MWREQFIESLLPISPDNKKAVVEPRLKLCCVMVQQDNDSNRWQEGLLAICCAQQVGLFTQ
jgi:hypothetical protein